MHIDFTGIHHLRLPTSHLDESVEWLARVAGAIEDRALAHRDAGGEVYARVLRVSGIPVPILAVAAPEQASIPLGLLVGDVDAWVARCEREALVFSPPIVRVGGRSIDVSGPGGVVLRLFQAPAVAVSGESEGV